MAHKPRKQKFCVTLAPVNGGGEGVAIDQAMAKRCSRTEPKADRYFFHLERTLKSMGLQNTFKPIKLVE